MCGSTSRTRELRSLYPLTLTNGDLYLPITPNHQYSFPSWLRGVKRHTRNESGITLVTAPEIWLKTVSAITFPNVPSNFPFPLPLGVANRLIGKKKHHNEPRFLVVSNRNLGTSWKNEVIRNATRRVLTLYACVSVDLLDPDPKPPKSWSIPES